jgi:lambda repressor-like predicted transcriptional regulator
MDKPELERVERVQANFSGLRTLLRANQCRFSINSPTDTDRAPTRHWTARRGRSFRPKFENEKSVIAINAQVNVPRILAGMKSNGWGVAATCVNCGINNKTLSKMLNGQIPHRLDALYRLIDGLKIPMEEALISGSAHKEARLLLLRSRRRDQNIA